MSIANNREAWHAISGDKTLLLNHPVETGIVLDVGGYRGGWTSEILTRMRNDARIARVYVFEPVREFYEELRKNFDHEKRVVIVPVGLSDHTGPATMSKDVDASSLHIAAGDEPVDLLDVAEFFEKNIVGDVDLVNINIEGHEFVLLPRMIETGVIKKCKNVQVQFHAFYSQADALRNKIREELAQTHTESFCYPFVWEGWKRK